MEKQCICCNQVKSLSEFKFRKDNQKHRNSCKQCDNEKLKVWKRENDYDKLQYQKHRDKKLAHVRAYRQRSDYRDKANAWGKQWRKKQKAINPTYKIIHNLRRRCLLALHGHYKAETTLNLIGCTSDELKRHLESLWQEGMSWDNYGLHGWHIDHIKPLSSFDLSLEEEQKKAFHYTNLQPLWAKDNLIKSNK